MTVRRACSADAARLAELHVTRVGEGFLPTLGADFLRRLYRRIVASPDAFAFVADDGDGRVVGFAAAAVDVGRLYRRFLLRDGVVAGLSAAPRLVRSWRRVLETLRYAGASGDLPGAEILAVAVDESATGRGVGRDVVVAAVDELERRGVTAVKVVAAADNATAIRLYQRCGFAPRARVALHPGTESEVLVWSSS